MRSTGSFYEVLANGKMHTCKVRGKIRLENIKETNPVAVGDQVDFHLENEIGVITTILPRSNHILRQSVKKTGHTHVLAANVDQAMLIATVAMPRTSLGFIDRFLVTAEAYGIPQLLIFNKQDLLSADELPLVDRYMQLYTATGVTCKLISAAKDSLGEINLLLQHKTTLIAGHSGVGKSTVLNKIAPTIDQRVGDISDYSEKGTHTTTFAEMFQLNEDTFVIDTPGIKEWGLANMDQQELSDYFPEMREIRSECKFGSKCLHLHEPKCAIQEAVRNGTIAASRFDSYVSMVLGEDNRK